MMHPATLVPSLLAGWPGFAALLLCIVLAKAVITLTASRRYREMRVSSALRGLDTATYRHFPGLRLPHPDERRPVRIPHVVVSPFGIFVIDTVRRRGSIFGTEYDARWTQRLRFHTRRIANPMRRNRIHVEALMAYLDLPDPPFRPLVVFTNPCILETPHPDVVPTDQLIPWLRRHKVTILDSSMVARADARLADLRDALNRPTETQPHELHVTQAV